MTIDELGEWIKSQAPGQIHTIESNFPTFQVLSPVSPKDHQTQSSDSNTLDIIDIEVPTDPFDGWGETLEKALDNLFSKLQPYLGFSIPEDRYKALLIRKPLTCERAFNPEAQKEEVRASVRLGIGVI